MFLLRYKLDVDHNYLQSVEKIKLARIRCGLSLRDLSKITKVNFTNIHRMEHGKDIMSSDFLTLLDWSRPHQPEYIHHKESVKEKKP